MRVPYLGPSPFMRQGRGRKPTFPLNGHKMLPDLSPVASTTSNAVAEAAAKTDREPSEAQKESGNYKKGKFKWNGLTIAIENPRGSIRSGVGKGGKPWSVKLAHHYGYFVRTDSDADGDPVDVFVGPHPTSDKVFIVNQTKEDGKTFDEHKCLIGFDSEAEARRGYLDCYSPGWKGLGSIVEKTVEEFKEWLADGDTGRRIKSLPDDSKGRWVTINGAHVFVQDGKIVKGPKEMIGEDKPQEGMDRVRERLDKKAMSYLNNATGGALVPPPAQPKRKLQPSILRKGMQPPKVGSSSFDEFKHPRDQGGQFAESEGRNVAQESSEPEKGGWTVAEIGAAAWDDLRKLGASAAALENAVKEWVESGIEKNVARLPDKVQIAVKGVWRAIRLGSKVAFATYTAGQNLAEEVAKARGATPEQAARLRAVLSAVDIATFKPISIGMSMAVGPAGAGAASFVPVGSATYLAWSTARDPLAVYAAAKVSVRKAMGKKDKGLSKGGDVAHAAFDFLSGGDDRVAVLLAALDETGDLREALKVAKEAVARGQAEGKKFIVGRPSFLQMRTKALSIPRVRRPIALPAFGKAQPTGTSYGQLIQMWLRDGVPGLKGTIDGDSVLDNPVRIPATHPLFGLACIEAFERMMDEGGSKTKALPRYQIKALQLKPPSVKKESYFATCERDKLGHCLPSGQVGQSATEEPKAQEEPQGRLPSDVWDKVKDKLEKLKLHLYAEGKEQSDKDILTMIALPGSKAEKARRDLLDAVYESGQFVSNAVLQLADTDNPEMKKFLIKYLATGNIARAVEEYADTPMWDLQVLGGIEVLNTPVDGQAVCYMNSRKLRMGSTSVTGDFRHELGHAVRAFFGSTSSLTRAVKHHYNEVMEKVKANPAGKNSKMSHDWYEENYGVIGSRALDNFEEDFAEHYRGYHKAVYQDKQNGDSKNLDRYRQLHPEMAKIFDAHYTAALLARAEGKMKFDKGEAAKEKAKEPPTPEETQAASWQAPAAEMMQAPPKTKPVDTSTWSPTNSSAKWGVKKIAQFEALAAEGKWEEFEAAKFTTTSSKPNNYQKAVMKAWDQLKAGQLAKADSKPKPTSEWKEIKDWKKVGGQLGSNPGAQMEDSTGKKWYVKHSKTEPHAKSEVLGGKLYALAGAMVPELDLADTGNGLGVASAWVDSTGKFDSSSKQAKNQAAQDFAVHAWLGNWDAMGASFDNQVTVKGSLMTVDVGGTLGYRAQGEEKEFGNSVKEWNTLRDSSINPNCAKVFGGMTDDQLIAASFKVSSISDESIDMLVDKYGPDESKDKLKKTLKARRDWIKGWADGKNQELGIKAEEEKKAEQEMAIKAEEEQKAEQEKAAETKPAEGSKPTTNEGQSEFAVGTKVKTSLGDEGEVLDVIDSSSGKVYKISTPDGGYAWHNGKFVDPIESDKPAEKPAAGPPPALPAKPIVTSAANASAQKKFDAIWNAAASGDIAAVEAIPTSADAKQTYSKKHHQYKMAMLAALKSGAAPSQETPTQSAPKSAVEKVKDEPKPIKVDPSKFPEKPTFQSSNESNVLTNKASVNQILKLATNGDLEGLQAFPDSPSPKVQAYKNSMISIVDNQLHPPAPPKTYSGQLDHLKKVFKGSKDPQAKHAQKIGYYLVTEEPGIPDVDLGNIALSSVSGSKYRLADNDLHQQHEVAYATIPTDAKNILKSYTGGGFAEINNSLWSGNPTPVAKKIANALINHSPELQMGVKLYRKITLSESDIAKLESSVGKVVQEPSVSSTSINKDVWHGNVHWAFKTSPGVKGLYIAPHSDHDHEEEMLLPPGTRYYISAAKMKGEKLHIDAILLPTVPGQSGV